MEARIRDYCSSRRRDARGRSMLKASLPLLSPSTLLACGNASEQAVNVREDGRCRDDSDGPDRGRGYRDHYRGL